MPMNPVAKRVLIILVPIFILMGGGLLYFGIMLAPGYDVDAEEYEFNVSDSELIHAVELFKTENSKYCLPFETGLKDGRGDNPDNNLYYHVYFYYPEENQIVYGWIRQTPYVKETKTTFAFVGINSSLQLGNWRDINRDFTRAANKEQIKKFEERILSKIESRLGKRHLD
jgi:hypothetical protein